MNYAQIYCVKIHDRIQVNCVPLIACKFIKVKRHDVAYQTKLSQQESEVISSAPILSITACCFKFRAWLLVRHFIAVRLRVMISIFVRFGFPYGSWDGILYKNMWTSIC